MLFLLKNSYQLWRQTKRPTLHKSISQLLRRLFARFVRTTISSIPNCQNQLEELCNVVCTVRDAGFRGLSLTFSPKIVQANGPEFWTKVIVCSYFKKAPTLKQPTSAQLDARGGAGLLVRASRNILRDQHVVTSLNQLFIDSPHYFSGIYHVPCYVSGPNEGALTKKTKKPKTPSLKIKEETAKAPALTAISREKKNSLLYLTHTQPCLTKRESGAAL